MQWIASVERIEALKPKIVIAGHKRPDARDDDPATILGHTKSYIRDPICSGPSSRQSAAATSGSSALTTSTERSPAPATSQSARPGYALRYRSPPPTTATQTAKPPRPAPPAWWAPHPPARPPERRAPPEGAPAGDAATLRPPELKEREIAFSLMTSMSESETRDAVRRLLLNLSNAADDGNISWAQIQVKVVVAEEAADQVEQDVRDTGTNPSTHSV
jgi:hypothetical protein